MLTRRADVAFHFQNVGLRPIAEIDREFAQEAARMTFRPEGDGDLPLSAGRYGTPVEIRLQASARGFDLGRRDGFPSPVDECERMPR